MPKPPNESINLRCAITGSHPHHLDPSVPFYQLENKWKQNRVEFMNRGAVDPSYPTEPWTH